MDNGYILVHRKIWEWEWHDDPHTGWLWIYIITHANWKYKKWHGIPVSRGQLLTSQNTLSLATGLSRQQIRTSLTKLVNTKELTIKATKSFTLITVLNYNTYQCNEKTSTNKSTINQPTSNQEVTITNKVIRKEDSTIGKVAFFECPYFEVSNEEVTGYCEAYNLTSDILKAEFFKMSIWLKSNPSRRKKNYGRFIQNWIGRLNKTQDGRSGGGLQAKEELNRYIEQTFKGTVST